MPWDAIGAIGEIVGAAAVVVTLWFLIRQLNQNTKTIHAQTRASLTQDALSSIRLPIDSPELARAMAARGGVEVSELLLRNSTRYILRQWENACYQYRMGLYDDEYEAHQVLWRPLLAQPSMREEWERVKPTFSRPLRVMMDSLSESNE